MLLCGGLESFVRIDRAGLFHRSQGEKKKQRSDNGPLKWLGESCTAISHYLVVVRVLVNVLK